MSGADRQIPGCVGYGAPSEPTASDLAADVRAVLKNTVGIDARPPLEAMESLDALVARVDTLTRERDEQKAWIDRVAQTSTDAATAAEAAEQRAEAAEAALADQQRSLIAVRDAAQAVWDYAYEREGELDALVPLPELSALGRALKLGGGS